MLTYSPIDNILTLDMTRSKFMTILYTISLCETNDAISYFRMHEKSWLATYPNRHLGITKKALKSSLNTQSLTQKVLRLTKLIENGKKPLFYVLKIEDKVIGMFDLALTKKEGEIKMLYLDPDYIGQGFGHDLISYAFDTLKTNGCKTVSVRVVDYNTRAIQFYLSHGFKAIGLIKNEFEIIEGVKLNSYQMKRKL